MERPLIAQPHVPPNRLGFVAGLLLCVERGRRGAGGEGQGAVERPNRTIAMRRSTKICDATPAAGRRCLRFIARWAGAYGREDLWPFSVLRNTARFFGDGGWRRVTIERETICRACLFCDTPTDFLHCV